MQRSLRTRLTILFLAIAIIPLVLVAIFGVQQSISAQINQNLAQQNVIAQRVATSVGEYIQGAENSLRLLIEVRNIESLSLYEVRIIFTNMLSFSGVYNELTLVDRFGAETVKVSRDVFAGDIVLGNITGSPEYEQPLETKQTYYGNISFDEFTGEPFMTVSVPIINLASGEVFGFLVSKLELKQVWALMSEASTSDMSVFMVDPSNNVVAHSNPSVVLGGNRFEKTFDGALGPGLVNDVASLGSAPVNINGREVFNIFTELPASVALGPTIQFSITAIIVFILTVIGISVFSITQTRQITQPIEDLANSAKAIEAGNYDARVDIQRGDELGTLGNSFNQMAEQLRSVMFGLEQRVTERTRDLETQTQELESITEKIQASADNLRIIADISRSIATVREIDTLLPSIAQTISERFDYYHVGIFLLDANDAYAVLRASNSEGGQRMLDRGHKLKVGETGLVGTVANSGYPRIALDTGKDSVFFNNPDLPGTRSEVALPLKIAGRIIGVLDVQSIEPEAFDQEDIGLLEILADQVSIAIENARLLQETERSLQQAEATYRQFVRQEWGSFIRARKTKLGYSLSGGNLAEISDLDLQPEIQQVVTTGEAYYDTAKGRTIIPLLLRGEIIGTLDVSSGKRTLEADEIEIAEAIAERVASTIEVARLLRDSQHRAVKEQTISEITSRIGASIDMRSLLQTAVEELGRTMPGSDIVVQLQKAEDND